MNESGLRRGVRREVTATRGAALRAGLVVALCALLAACAGAPDRRLASGWAELGSAWAERGDWGKAAAAWERALALDPGYDLAAFNLARARVEQGRYEDSLALALRLLKRDPALLSAMAIQAYALARLGRLDEALAVYERVVAANPADEAALKNLDAIRAAMPAPAADGDKPAGEAGTPAGAPTEGEAEAPVDASPPSP